MKIAFVTNICAHYRINTFETFAKYFDVDYYFFSAGEEWYWQRSHGVRAGNFTHQYLPGFNIGKTRITPTLPWKLGLNSYDVYIKCINGKFALPITYIIARVKRKPIVLWTGIWTRLASPIHKIFFPITRYIYMNSDAVVVYGKHVKEYLESEGVKPENIFIAAHAVDNSEYNKDILETDKRELLNNLGINSASKIILYIGRLEASKGLNYLIESYAKLNSQDSILVICGIGSEESQLMELVKEKGIDKQVRFLGYIPPEKTWIYYSLAWVFVLPSITTRAGKEPWGLVVNEAFNQGVPVICTDAVGAAAGGLVQDGVNGFIVPECNSQALASALEKILTDKELHNCMVQHSKQIISSWDNEMMVLGFREAIDYVTKSR